MTSARSVLLIGGNRFPFHRFETNGPLLADAIPDGIDVTRTTEKAALEDLSGYDAVVDYLTDSTLSDAQRDGLLDFVADGGGYLGVHCAADLTNTAADDPDAVIDAREEPFPELRELVGGHFLTHPEQTTYDVSVVDHYHPVTAALEDFAVHDEPYVLDVDDDVRVLARMDHPEHADMPVAWTNEYGDGRVFYSSLGHDEASLTNDAVRALLANAVRWVTRD
ncbi:ThuA domain-containing protein (plasmid) [Halarchaeum sp. CBA1220]|uniref:ThuA domain-containing protein n=1 Tax=Halarchaeum sp. CBA1220 TaxID=1853682 RepID=UPI000F3A9509|nr:ThuA domain-containing protein [Halarchaeum sp. CBA1220]QLC34794.1 ThuA domain-containing protein [Halarchaeum sp. CBA1220]